MLINNLLEQKLLVPSVYKQIVLVPFTAKGHPRGRLVSGLSKLLHFSLNHAKSELRVLIGLYIGHTPFLTVTFFHFYVIYRSTNGQKSFPVYKNYNICCHHFQ